MDEVEDGMGLAEGLGVNDPRELVDAIKAQMERCKVIKVPYDLVVRAIEAGMSGDDAMSLIEAAAAANLPGAEKGMEFVLRIATALIKSEG